MYCCIGVNYDNQYNNACVDGATPFSLPEATPILGFAGLATAQAVPLASTASISSGTSSGTSSPATGTSAPSGEASLATCVAQTEPAHPSSVAIGAGVGVPLGVAALFAVGWAIAERRARKRAGKETQTLKDQIGHMQPLGDMGQEHRPEPKIVYTGNAELPSTREPAELDPHVNNYYAR